MSSKYLLALAVFLTFTLGPSDPHSLFAQATTPRPSAHPSKSPTATLKGDPAHPAHGARWLDTQLYFGLGPADSPDKGVDEAGWRDFLDKEITPRFPAGLSVIDVYGQWQGKDQKVPERIRSKLLVVDYPATVQNNARVEAIRAAWKQRTGDLSVLKITRAAEVSF